MEKSGERKSWTPEEDAVIRAGREKNTPYDDIAAQLPGRTRSAVSVRAHQLRGIDRAAGVPGPVSVAAAPAPVQTSIPGTEAAPKRRGRPPKAKPEGAAAAAPTPAPVAVEAPAAAPKRRGRPPKAAPVETAAPVAAAPAAAPVAAAAPRPARTPRAAKPTVREIAPKEANGHAHVSNGNAVAMAVNAGSLSDLVLNQRTQLKVSGAQVELVPGGLRFNFGDGRFAEVAAAPAA